MSTNRLMELRQHPLMSYRGVANWPPAWVWRSGRQYKSIRGEMGTLKSVTPSVIPPPNRLFLLIEHEQNEYVGCLLFQDLTFCTQMLALLRAYRGCSIEQIGGLDLSDLL